MPGCVSLNFVTIWLSNVSVAPDHMVSHVMFTTWALATLAVPIPAALHNAAVAIAAPVLARYRCFNHFGRQESVWSERLAASFACPPRWSILSSFFVGSGQLL